MIVGSLSVALIIASGVFSITLALVVAFFLGLMVIVLPYVSLKVSAKYDRDLKNYRNQLFSNLTDDVLGLQDWVLSGRKEDFLLDYQTSEKAARQIQEKLLSYVRKRNLVLQLIFALLVVYLIVWSGSTLNAGDAPNYIAAVSLAAFPLFDAFAPLSDAVVETQRYGDSVQRLNDLPDVKEEVRQETITETDLQISNLSFAFDDKLIFDDLNLHIKKGEHVAILGRSGVGKSTLASLIRGDLIAQQGTLDLSGIAPAYANNVEEKIGVINQSPYIFNASIRSNLSLARLDASDEEIWNALELVGLKKMVASLPNQLNEVVDEAGLRFSGGNVSV